VTAVTGEVTVGGTAYPATATVTLPAPAPAPVRSPYDWPFAWDSCWNMPVSASATYGPTGPGGTGSLWSTDDYSTVMPWAPEGNSVSPSFPLKPFDDAGQGAKTVHCDPGLHGNGQWNSTCAFLDEDGDTVWMAQTLQLAPGGNPSIGGVGTYALPGLSITTSTGNPGAHGGSSLSCLGGTLTKADLAVGGPVLDQAGNPILDQAENPVLDQAENPVLDQSGGGAIRHAMKVCFNGLMFYSCAGPNNSRAGWQWPAANADGGFDEPGNVNYYGGSNQLIVEGALLALPPSIDIGTRYSDPLVQKIATAMMNYGAYICDNTASGAGNATSLVEINYDAAPYFKGTGTFTSDLLRMYSDLMVVTNSTEATPGGGALGTRRLAPFAPPFTAAPKIGTLADDFTLNRLATVWADRAGTVTWSAGEAAIECAAGYGSWLQPPGAYDLTNSGIYAKVSPYIAPGAATNLMLGVSTGNNLFIGYAGGDLAVNSNIRGAQKTLFATAYSATAHAWWRIREAGGVTYFDASPDGVTWTSLYSAADYVFGFPLASLDVTFQAGVYGGGAGGVSYVRAVNTPAGVSPPSPSSR
jgi:hypothetical protein